jgi:hypothetical protein
MLHEYAFSDAGGSGLGVLAAHTFVTCLAGPAGSRQRSIGDGTGVQ